MATLSKLDLENSCQSLFVLSEFQDNAVSLQVSDGVRAWQGSLSTTQLKALAERSKLTLKSFLTDTRKALSRKDLGELSFLYSAKHLEDDKLELTWKKHILSENIKFQLGQVELCSRPSACIVPPLISFGIDSISELQQRLGQLEAKCVRLTREREEALQILRQHASIQEQVEKDLFSKFKVVLNEKKAKIRNVMELKRHLVEQSEELRQKLWTHSTSSSAPADDKVTAAREGSPEKAAAGLECQTPPVPNINNSSNSTGATSLLGDVQCRAPSPPPIKRPRHTTRPHKSLTDLSCPLATNVSFSTRKTSHISQAKEDKELDSDELLDML